MQFWYQYFENISTVDYLQKYENCKTIQSLSSAGYTFILLFIWLNIFLKSEQLFQLCYSMKTDITNMQLNLHTDYLSHTFKYTLGWMAPPMFIIFHAWVSQSNNHWITQMIVSRRSQESCLIVKLNNVFNFQTFWRYFLPNMLPCVAPLYSKTG